MCTSPGKGPQQWFFLTGSGVTRTCGDTLPRRLRTDFGRFFLTMSGLAVYDDTLRETVPDEFLRLIGKLD